MANGGRVTHAPPIPRLGVPPYGWGAECLHGAGQAGPATSFPQAIGLAAIFSASFHYELATAISLEVRSKHNNYSAHGYYGEHTGASCWSPNINIMRDPRWGRNEETYGEDPYLTGELAQSFVAALQGDHPRYVRANAGCKHFAVHSGPENIPVGRDDFDALVSERDFRMTYLPAFKKCVEAGTYSLMCSYNKINGVPACANNRLLTSVLRDEWGFKGYVISDEMAIENIRLSHGYSQSKEQTCELSIKAGCNLEDGPCCGLAPDFLAIADAVTMGLLTEEEVREAIKPLFYTRMRLGQFDPPEMNPYAALDPLDYVQSAAHQGLSLSAALKSFVLLKNERTLPLAEGTKFGKIAIVGPMANNIPGIFGSYAPDPDPRYVVTPLQGLSVLGETVGFAEGCSLSSGRCLNATYNAAAVIAAVTEADFVVVALGTGGRVESESNDRADLNLPGAQLQLLLDAVQHSGSAPVVLLLFNGGPLDVTWAKNSPRVSVIVECFFPGQTTGEALRRLLLNEGPSANPAGRLPSTWPASLDQVPPMVDYSMLGRTYRYFDGVPLYPFGYGLSYSTFRYTFLRISPPVATPTGVTAEINLVNDGPYQGEEVVQLYVAWTNPSLPAPRLQLVAFERFAINAGAQRDLYFLITLEQIAVWRDDPAGFVTLAGDYAVYAGGQQPGQETSAPSNVITGTFSVQQTIVWPTSNKK
jgi:beta-glucosidase